MQRKEVSECGGSTPLLNAVASVLKRGRARAPQSGFAATVLMASVVCAAPVEQSRTLIFDDNFDRNELQEEKEEIGNGWTSNSESRADGKKQADLKDGVLHFWTRKDARHRVSLVHAAGFKDGLLEMRFLLDDPKGYLHVDFAVPGENHIALGGHLFSIQIDAARIRISDSITGKKNPELNKLKETGPLTPAQEQVLKKSRRDISHELDPEKWHQLSVEVVGERLVIKLDGDEAATMVSPGFAYPEKKAIRLGAVTKASIDDLKLYRYDKSKRSAQ